MAASDETASAINSQPPRKFSLPWFRQSSFGLGSSKTRGLPKQHTIAGDRLSPEHINEVGLFKDIK